MKIIVWILLGLGYIFPAYAEELANHSEHVASTNNDNRQLVVYPPEVRAHALANMRGHLQAVAEVMNALAMSQFVKAADIAQNQLGMNSSGAAGCHMDGQDSKDMSMSESTHLDHMMSRLMPWEMKELGQNMHRSADEFAVLARNAGEHGENNTVLLGAFAKVTQQCVTCHASYRLQ